MSTYCISDIHGCYDEFIGLIGLIQFDPEQDTLYVLGDVVDRGERPVDCLSFTRKTKNVHLILGNHEKMMLEFCDEFKTNWFRNGCLSTLEQLSSGTDSERDKILTHLRKRPFYKTVNVNGKRFFLSHSGLDVSLPFCRQQPNDLLWSRDEFYSNMALPQHICIFGHTPTFYIRKSYDCSVWVDTKYSDKICIDCGCVYGGALAALRLDDGKVFYVKSSRENADGKYYFTLDSTPVNFSEYDKLDVDKGRVCSVIA